MKDLSKLSLRPILVFAVFTGLILFPLRGISQETRQINSSGTTQPAAVPVGSPAIQSPEIDSGLAGSDSDDDLGIDLQGNITGKTQLNRAIAPGPGQGQTVAGSAKAKSNPEVVNSFDGLNFFNQRFANNGNQFSVEPPDQALCAGNGFVLESVNDVLNIYGADGTSLLGVTDLNTFYGYPPAINRAANPLTFGPSITDPTCHFDPDTQRWFHVALTLDRAAPTTQNLNGKNHFDIAVSTTSNPLGSWVVYHVPVQNDGTDGTPDHRCVARVKGVLVHAQCLGDYPHIGMDANALFITTNEFDLFSPGRFHGAQIYAISKHALVAGATANVVLFNTAALAPSLPFGIPGFTVFPALSPDTNFRTDNNGTEFFLSSLAVFSTTGAFDKLVEWELTNTQAIDSAPLGVTLTAGLVSTQVYAVPPGSHQQGGDFPLGQCLADNTITTPFGVGCWRFFVGAGGPFINPEITLPSNDSRMQEVFYANGKLWAALDTGVVVDGHNQAGAAFFVLQPKGSFTNPTSSVITQGIIALSNNNVTYPAVGVTSSGRGVIAFTVVGNDNFPSAGYASLDALAGAGDVHVVAAGAGPDDGFTGYFPEVNPVRPRWGDYGAAAVDGNSIWIASEYIAQTCNLSTYVATNFTCGNTRGSLGNWATRISHVTF